MFAKIDHTDNIVGLQLRTKCTSQYLHLSPKICSVLTEVRPVHILYLDKTVYVVCNTSFD